MRRTVAIAAFAFGAAAQGTAACTGADPDLETSSTPDAAADTTSAAVDVTAPAEDVLDAGAGAVPDAMPAAECVQPSAASTVLAHTEYGYRDAQGGCGWSYHYAVPATIELSSPMTIFDGGKWYAPAPSIAHLVAAGGHPSTSYVAIRRWVSTFGGDIRVRGTVTAPDSMVGVPDRDGVTFAIMRNGMVVQSIDVVGAPANVDRGLRVELDDRVDLVLTSRNTTTFDSTSYAIEIARD